MKVSTVTIDMELLGAEFAGLDSKEQASFFHGLAQELKRFPSQHAAQLQFAYVSDDIPPSDREILENALCMIMPEKDGSHVR